jgi:hypothetical protein
LNYHVKIINKAYFTVEFQHDIENNVKKCETVSA